MRIIENMYQGTFISGRNLKNDGHHYFYFKVCPPLNQLILYPAYVYGILYNICKLKGGSRGAIYTYRKWAFISKFNVARLVLFFSTWIQFHYDVHTADMFPLDYRLTGLSPYTIYSLYIASTCRYSFR